MTEAQARLARTLALAKLDGNGTTEDLHRIFGTDSTEEV
jgi:hypothetical protein